MNRSAYNIQEAKLDGTTIYSINGTLNRDTLEELSRIIVDDNNGAPCFVHVFPVDNIYKYIPYAGVLRPMYAVGTDPYKDPACIKLTRAVAKVDYQQHPYTYNNHETY